MMSRTIASILVLLFLLPATAQKGTLERFVAEAKKKQRFEPADVAQAEELIKSAKEGKTLQDAFVMLANTYVSLEQYDAAYGYYLKALELSEKSGRYKNIAYISSQLGSVQVHFGNYEKSLDLFVKARDNYTKVGEKQGVAGEEGNIAVAQLNLGKVDEAIATLEGIINGKEIGAGMKASAYFTMGTICFMKRDDPAKATEYYLGSLALAGLEDSRFRVLLFQNLAESYIALKKYDKAYHYNSLSEPLVEELGSNELRATLHLYYSQIAEARLLYDKAYQSLILHKKYQEKANLEQMRAKIDNLEAVKTIKQQQYDLQINRHKIKILEQQKTIGRIKNLTMFFLLVAFVFLILFVVKRYKKRVKVLDEQIVQTNDRLEYSQGKIDEMVLGIIRDNEFTEHLRSDMKAIQENITDPGIKQQFAGLIAGLRNFKMIRENREELFMQVHKDFLYNLEKKIPGLTEEEKQIVMLIYLNLKNKDIALVLNVSVRSVENTRYRIRKKAQLETADSLSEYIKTI